MRDSELLRVERAAPEYQFRVYNKPVCANFDILVQPRHNCQVDPQKTPQAEN
jgi:hypothetical protein